LINTAVRTWFQFGKNRGCTLPALQPQPTIPGGTKLNSRHIAAVLIASAVLFIAAAPVSAKTPVETSPLDKFPEEKQSLNTNRLGSGNLAEMADLEIFVKAVTTGEAGRVTGLFAPGLGQYYVIQQAPGKDTRVSPVDGVLTQYRRPSAGGVIGLLAHNYAAGVRFTQFEAGDRLYLVYGDGAVHTYRLTGFLRYQAVNRNDAGSNLIDLADGRVQSADAVYRRIYTGAPHLVLQTCLTYEGDLKWGRLFIMAEKIGQDN
jgi:hypothetical protein